MDIDEILSENEQWKKLEEEWGIPIDLEVDGDDDTPKMKPVFSSSNLKSPTFDSSFLFKKVRRQVGRQLSKKSTNSALEYNDFISHLREDPNKESSKQFYFVNGEITSATSIEDICAEIDDIFKSIEQLCTGTIKKKVPDVVQCSISATDLSFDDTREMTNYSEIERHIDEAFEQFDVSGIKGVDQTTLDSVTTLVRKFSHALNNPANRYSPKRRRECCEKFKDLADFWKNRAFECS